MECGSLKGYCKAGAGFCRCQHDEEVVELPCLWRGRQRQRKSRLPGRQPFVQVLLGKRQDAVQQCCFHGWKLKKTNKRPESTYLILRYVDSFLSRLGYFHCHVNGEACERRYLVASTCLDEARYPADLPDVYRLC